MAETSLAPGTSHGDIGLDIGRAITDYEQKIVEESIREFNQLMTWKATFGAQCEEVAELILPTSRNTFFYSDFNWPGIKKTDRQIDATGMLALERFAAICDSMLTPANQEWHGLKASDPYVMKDRATQLWFEDTTRRLFALRYKPESGFGAANTADYLELGAFGNAATLITTLDPVLTGGVTGIRYQHLGFGQVFFHQNYQGMIDGFIIWTKKTARQALQEFGPDHFPMILKQALDANSEMLYDFIQRVTPRTDRDPKRIDYKGMRYASYHICMGGRVLCKEGGFRSLPIAASRYMQAPGEVYGRGPAMAVLPALKTLNAMKATYLKQAHRNADPVLLSADDGVVTMNMRPGSVNKGGVDSQGRELVKVLPTGNMQVAKEMMEGEAALINDVFLITLFQILVKTPTMSATEVIERMNEKGILIAPTLTRQQGERLGPMVHRELDVGMSQRLFMPMPPRLREARGEYTMVWTSPLARAARMQEASGFMRTVEMAKEVANITQDMSVMDPFDFDVAIPDIASIQGVKPSWMSDAKAIQNKRLMRAKAQDRRDKINALPAQAAMVKAQAVAQKAGGQPPVGPAQQPAQAGPPLTQNP